MVYAFATSSLLRILSRETLSIIGRKHAFGPIESCKALCGIARGLSFHLLILVVKLSCVAKPLALQEMFRAGKSI